MKLRRLRITNFFSFGDADIDFINKPSPVLIKGQTQDSSQSNGSGKSSMLESFYWCITGKTIRGVRAADVIRLGAQACVVVADIQFNSKSLSVTRHYSASKKTVEINYEGREESFHDSKQGTARIFEILGIDDETLALASFFGSSFITFSGLGPQARSDVIDKLAQGSKWERARGLAVSKAKAIERNLEELQNVLNKKTEEADNGVSSLESTRIQYKEKRAELDREIEALNNKIAELETDLSRVNEELASLEQTDTSSFSKAIEEFESMKSKVVSKRDAERSAHSESENEIKNSIQGHEKELDTCRQDVNLAHRNKTTAELRIESITEELKRLRTEEKTNECSSCGQALPSTDNADERAAKITNKTEALKGEEDKLVSYQNTSDESSTKSVEIKASIESLQAELRNTSPIYEATKEKHEQDLNAIDAEISKCRKEASEVSEKSNTLLRRKSEIENPLSSRKQDLTRLESNEDCVRLQTRLESIEAALASIREGIGKTRDGIKTEQGNLELTKFWANGFKEIRFAAFDNTVCALEGLLNAYAKQQGLDFDTIEVSSRKVLATGKEKPQIEIYLHRGTERLALDGLSEGETQRVNIACFLAIGALIEKHVGYPLELKILDEPLGGVDADGKHRIFTILAELADAGKQVLTIDHDANFQDLCPTVITVRKEDGISRIE